MTQPRIPPAQCGAAGRTAIVVAVVCLLSASLAVSALAILNYRGVCLSGPELSDEERIDRVIDRFLTSSQSAPEEIVIESEVDGARKVVVRYLAHTDNVMRYTDRAEFLSVNPDCCATAEAGPKGNVPDFLTRITGGFSGFVRLRFVARLKMEDSDVRLLPREEFYAISNCGKVWDGI